MAARDIEIANLRLDEENPRHDYVSGERELIAALFQGLGGAKIVKLAEHIVANGMSPTDNAIVISNGDGTFTVVEGNRRVAAVKLLADPSLAPSKGHEATFRRLRAAMSTPVTAISAVEVKDRETARPWILLRHDGEAEGASVVGWNTVQKQRFTGKSGTQTALALMVIDALKAADPTNEKLTALLGKITERKSTTLGRLIMNAPVRTLLGITKSDPVTSTRLSQSELTEVWSKIAADLAAGAKNVSDFKRSEQMQTYVAGLLPAYLKPAVARPIESPATSPVTPSATKPAPPPSVAPVLAEPLVVPTPVPNPALVPEAAAALAPSGGSAPDPTAPSPTRPKSEPLFGGVQLNKLGVRVQGVLFEVYKLDVEQFPNSSAVMVRVLVELAVDAVFDRKGWSKAEIVKSGHLVDKKLAAKIKECLAALDPSGKDSRFQALRTTLTQKDGMFSVTTMNAVVHNPYFLPVPRDIRKMAQNYTPFLAALDTLVS